MSPFSPDGKRLLSGSWDGTLGTLKLWDLETGRALRTLTAHSATGQTAGITSVAFSPDGKRLLSGSDAFPGSDDFTLNLWDAATGKEIRTFTRTWLEKDGHICGETSVAFSPDGKRLLSGSYDRTLKLWDAETGADLRTFIGHTEHFTSVAFSPDSTRLLSGSADKTLKLWDAATGAEVRTFTGHSAWVSSVAFSPDGKRLLSGSGDETLKLWDAETGKELRTFAGHSFISSVAFSPDGKRLLSGGGYGTVRVWDFSRASVYREFEEHRIPAAQKALSKNPDDPASLDTFGEWYHFRGVWDWAIDFLERARSTGFEISALKLGQCYWHTKKYPEASREYQRELARVQALPASADEKGKRARDDEEFHLLLCIGALQRAIDRKE